MQLSMPSGLGAVIAIIVLVVDIVLAVIGHPPGGNEVAAMIGALAVARLT